MKRYMEYVNNYKGFYVLLLLFAGIISICNLVRTYFLSVIIDDVVELRNLSILKNIVIILVLIVLLEQAISYTVGYVNTYVSQNISFSLRETLIKKISRIYLQNIQQYMSSEFVVNLTEDVNNVTNALCNYLVALLNSVFAVILTISLILYLNMKLAIISFVIITIQVIVSIYLSRITKKNQSDILKNNSVHMGLIKQFVNQMKYMRAYRIENKMIRDYNVCSNKIVRLNYISYLINYIYGNISTILNFMGSLIIFIIGVIYVYSGTISIGILFVFDSLTDMLNGNITNIVNLLIAYAKASVSFVRINAIYDAEEEQREGGLVEKTITDIEYNNVDFKYKDNIVLKDFSCKMKQGNFYAIVGKSGIGKSTLFQLLLKFYNIEQGKIYINGEDLNTLSIDSLRDRITTVFQDGCIIDGCTIRENICFGNEVEEKKFNEIVKACHISDFAEKLPQGYNAIIHENGVNLSGGEKQRIYIARALLRDTDVYIFDEAFSQMDTSLENQIISYIKSIYRDKLIIIVSHNIDMIRNIETILAFENDKTISCGNDKYLLKNSKVYQEFIRGENAF